jgi:hypothetical protein
MSGAILITPEEGEFFLGEFAADDRIVQETQSNRVVRAFVHRERTREVG